MLSGGGFEGVWLPEAAHEALRDLVRAREVGKVSRFASERQPMGYSGAVSRSTAWQCRVRCGATRPSDANTPAYIACQSEQSAFGKASPLFSVDAATWNPGSQRERASSSHG